MKISVSLLLMGAVVLTIDSATAAADCAVAWADMKARQTATTAEIERLRRLSGPDFQSHVADLRKEESARLQENLADLDASLTDVSASLKANAGDLAGVRSSRDALAHELLPLWREARNAEKEMSWVSRKVGLLFGGERQVRLKKVQDRIAELQKEARTSTSTRTGLRNEGSDLQSNAEKIRQELARERAIEADFDAHIGRMAEASKEKMLAEASGLESGLPGELKKIAQSWVHDNLEALVQIRRAQSVVASAISSGGDASSRISSADLQISSAISAVDNARLAESNEAVTRMLSGDNNSGSSQLFNNLASSNSNYATESARSEISSANSAISSANDAARSFDSDVDAVRRVASEFRGSGVDANVGATTNIGWTNQLDTLFDVTGTNNGVSNFLFHMSVSSELNSAESSLRSASSQLSSLRSQIDSTTSSMERLRSSLSAEHQRLLDAEVERLYAAYSAQAQRSPTVP
jgi:hypothetical protein